MTGVYSHISFSIFNSFVVAKLSNMSKVRAVFLDMDGTALNSHHELTERTVQILRTLSENGVLVCFATGRSTSNLHKYILQLDLPQPIFPSVCYNGAYAFIYCKGGDSYENYEKEVIFSRPLQESDTRDILAFAAANGCVAQYYNGLAGQVLAVPQTEEHHELLGRYAALVGNKQVLLTDYEEAIQQSLSAKMIVMSNNIDAIIESAIETFGEDRFTLIKGSPHPFFMEFLTAGVTKGDGVRSVCEHFGLQADEIAVFGDGQNDVEMLQFASIFGFAMKNAGILAKEAAKQVLPFTNDEDGVAVQLEQMLADGLFAVKS
jgi:Cof subfamily protein (haloacid dehalogenase superfamily)